MKSLGLVEADTYLMDGWDDARIVQILNAENNHRKELTEVERGRGIQTMLSLGVPVADAAVSADVPEGKAESYVRDKWESFSVVGFGQPSGNRIAVEVDGPNGRRKVTYPDLPYVARYDHDGDFSWNCNNYVHGDMARIKPRDQQVVA